MRVVLTLLAVAGLAGAGWVPSGGGGGQGAPGVPPMAALHERDAGQPGSQRAGRRPASLSLVLHNGESGAECRAERSGRRGDARTFSAAPACDAVWPGLSAVARWVDREDGSAALTTASGEAVLTVMPGDGVAYEAVAPARALITASLAGR